MLSATGIPRIGKGLISLLDLTEFLETSEQRRSISLLLLFNLSGGLGRQIEECSVVAEQLILKCSSLHNEEVTIWTEIKINMFEISLSELRSVIK